MSVDYPVPLEGEPETNERDAKRLRVNFELDEKTEEALKSARGKCTSKGSFTEGKCSIITCTDDNHTPPQSKTQQRRGVDRYLQKWTLGPTAFVSTTYSILSMSRYADSLRTVFQQTDIDEYTDTNGHSIIRFYGITKVCDRSPSSYCNHTLIFNLRTIDWNRTETRSCVMHLASTTTYTGQRHRDSRTRTSRALSRAWNSAWAPRASFTMYKLQWRKAYTDTMEV